MSRRNPRQSAAAKEVPVVEASPVEAVAEVPVAEVVVASAEVPVASAEVAAVDATIAAPKKAVRKQPAAKALAMLIPGARVRHHQFEATNGELDSMAAPFKEHIRAFNHAQTVLTEAKVTELQQRTEGEGADAKTTVLKVVRDATPEELAAAKKLIAEKQPSLEEWTDQVAAFGRCKTRFSSNAATVTGIISERVLREIVEHSFKSCLASGKKTMNVNHVHHTGVESLSTYPLFSNLPSFKKRSEEYAALARKNELESTVATAVAAAILETEKAFRAKYEIKVQKSAKVKAEKPPKAAPVVEEEKDACKTSFKFYVGAVCDAVKSANAGYATIRVTDLFRIYLSDLTTEFCQRLTWLVSHHLKSKTVDKDTILEVVKGLLIDGHVPVKTVTTSVSEIPDPEAVKAEALKVKEGEASGKPYTPVSKDQLPKIKRKEAVLTVSYPDSGFDELLEEVEAKLKLLGVPEASEAESA